MTAATIGDDDEECARLRDRFYGPVSHVIGNQQQPRRAPGSMRFHSFRGHVMDDFLDSALRVCCDRYVDTLTFDVSNRPPCEMRHANGSPHAWPALTAPSSRAPHGFQGAARPAARAIIISLHRSSRHLFQPAQTTCIHWATTVVILPPQLLRPVLLWGSPASFYSVRRRGEDVSALLLALFLRYVFRFLTCFPACRCRALDSARALVMQVPQNPMWCGAHDVQNDSPRI